MITQTFNLNLIPESSPVVIHCDQYDKGTGRLIVKLYEGDVAYTPTGTAVIQGTKPDGKGFTYSATLSGNTVTADLTEQMSAVAGRVRCQIVVTESTGRTGTFVFILDVQRSALPANTDLSESDYQLIEQAIQDAQDAVEDAEAWAVGERGGIPVGPTDPTFENNSYFWCLQASQYAQGGLHYSGSVLFAYIPTTGMTVGDMYNIEDDFTTDSRFQEGAGIHCAAGTNIAWNPNNKWDILATAKIGTLDDLNDVSITTPSDNQVLTYDANSGEWINANAQGGATDLDDLTDVSITTPTDGQTLIYDANASEWVNGNGGGGSSTLAGLSDVTITTPSDGQALLYDANSGDWINGTVSGGGGMNTDGSNASTNVGMTGTKVFTIGSRHLKSSAGEYAFEIGDGANATGYGAYSEGSSDYYNGVTNSYTLTANTTVETLKTSISLTTYPYMCFGFGTLDNPANWEATVAGGLDNDITLTSGNASVRLHQNDTDVEVWYTNTGGTNVSLNSSRSNRQNVASGAFSHAEGSHALASGRNAHAEGMTTTASGTGSHAEGMNNSASGEYSHVEGAQNTAYGAYSHAEGYTVNALGMYSHAEGHGTTASSHSQHVAGKWNVVDSLDTYAVIIGNGTGTNARSNALTLDWTGNLIVAGDFTNGSSKTLNGVNSSINSVVTKSVAITGWSTDTTSQSGVTLYKKSITLSHVYAACPTVQIGSSGVLPTKAQQESFDLLQYTTINGTTLYLYSSAIPTTAYNIKITGAD